MKIRYTYEFSLPDQVADGMVQTDVIGREMSAPDRQIALSALNQILSGLEKALSQQILHRQGLAAVIQHVSMLGMAYTSEPPAVIKVQLVPPPSRQIVFEE